MKLPVRCRRLPLVPAALLLVPAVLPAADNPDSAPVAVAASYVAAARPGGDGRVLVSLVPRDPAVHVNEEPAPRLKLDPAQTVLADRQRPAPAARAAGADPATVKY